MEDRDQVRIEPDQTYRTAGIYSFGRGLFERDEIIGAETAYKVLYRLHRSQFVVSRLNGWEGAMDVVPDELDGCLVSNEYPTFSIQHNRAHPEYLRWIARWPGFWQHLVPRGSMVRRKRVQPDQLLEVEIPLPPLGEQLAIAKSLKRIGSLSTQVAELLKHANALSDALEVALASRSDLSEASKIQRGWRREPLGALMTPSIDRVEVQPNESYPNLGIYSFGRGLFEKIPIEGNGSSAKALNRVRSGQFIYSRLFAFEGAYGVVTQDFDGYFVSNEFPTFDVDSTQLDARWLAVYLRSRDRWMELASKSKGLGVRRQRVSIETVLSYEVWLPPIVEQHEMLKIVDAIETSRAQRQSVSPNIEALTAASVNKALDVVG
ncbi:MAG TPA: restriction endonuclease subunit S [Candidatus Dormibacteraeota bacterium]